MALSTHGFLRAMMPCFVCILMLLSIPGMSEAALSCDVRPFSKTIVQGESVLYAVQLSGGTAGKTYDVTTGDLPENVRMIFEQPMNSASVPSETSFILHSGDTAQTGSFSIIVFYREDGVPDTPRAVCQLHLSISSKPLDLSGANVSAPSADSLLFIPAGFISPVPRIGTSTVPSATITNTSARVGVSSANSFVFTTTLKRRNTGTAVMRLQERLQRLKLFPVNLEPTGFFGPITEDAVKKFQSEHGLETVGIVGPKTRALLNSI